MTERLDCVVVGAGVVGLACAAALAATGREVVVLEAADGIGSETSSRNSEVIHAGIYYPAGSLKARLCKAGRERLYDYCARTGVPHRKLGKLIVASDLHQRPKLDAIVATAVANGVSDLIHLDARELSALEPYIAAEAALLSPSTGIIDSHALMLALEGELASFGGMVVLRSPVLGGAVIADGFRVEIGGSEPIEVEARTLVNAAGLMAQTVARSLVGVPDDFIPPTFYAIGHYYRLSGTAPASHLVYPVPEAGGLGIHLTLDMGGQAKFGPDVRWRDRIDYRFDDSRFEEFADAIRIYYPELDVDRLQPDYTGIRPKLVGPGQSPADFRIDGPADHGIANLVNLFGIESPGLTASLAIGEHVAHLLEQPAITH